MKCELPTRVTVFIACDTVNTFSLFLFVKTFTFHLFLLYDAKAMSGSDKLCSSVFVYSVTKENFLKQMMLFISNVVVLQQFSRSAKKECLHDCSLCTFCLLYCWTTIICLNNTEEFLQKHFFPNQPFKELNTDKYFLSFELCKTNNIEKACLEKGVKMNGSQIYELKCTCVKVIRFIFSYFVELFSVQQRSDFILFQQINYSEK